MKNEDTKKTTIFTKTVNSQEKLLNPNGDRVLNWTVTPQDADLIRRIVVRAMDVLKRAKVEVSEMGGPKTPLLIDERTLAMDITAIHLNIRPLALYAFLLSGDSDFLQEIIGISALMDRKAIDLRGSFTPRFVAV